MNERMKAKKALDYFFAGYSCAQSVFTAFHEEIGLTESMALKIASGMGGGVAGMREICGAFTGMTLALGALRGSDVTDNPEAKKALYALIQERGECFRTEYGSLICRDLLESHNITPVPIPADRTAEYYRDRPCALYVEACAAYVEDVLSVK
ncbi:MAG: C_GCAxxG_C_C family protein [Clostridia bacterium]|nr:C_GCAxxG_C_C family protein [Clostridia bacterium]